MKDGIKNNLEHGCLSGNILPVIILRERNRTIAGLTNGHALDLFLKLCKERSLSQCKLMMIRLATFKRHAINGSLIINIDNIPILTGAIRNLLAGCLFLQLLSNFRFNICIAHCRYRRNIDLKSFSIADLCANLLSELSIEAVRALICILGLQVISNLIVRIRLFLFEYLLYCIKDNLLHSAEDKNAVAVVVSDERHRCLSFTESRNIESLAISQKSLSLVLLKFLIRECIMNPYFAVG